MSPEQPQHHALALERHALQHQQLAEVSTSTVQYSKVQYSTVQYSTEALHPTPCISWFQVVQQHNEVVTFREKQILQKSIGETWRMMMK